MLTVTKMMGQVRRAILPDYAESELGVQIHCNNRGELLNAPALPERTELVRQGNSWSVQLKEANAWTALTTVPTTLANLSLQNGELAGGKCYLIDRVWVKDVTTTAAANYVTILAQVVNPGTTLVANSANVTFNSLSGKPNYGGKAQIAVASTATGCVADKWVILGAAGINQPTSTSIAAAYEALCYGRYLVPPGGSFNVNAQEAVSGGTLIAGIEYHEVQIPLGA